MIQNSSACGQLRPIALIVIGASGRMGKRVCDLALTDERFSIIGRITRSSSTLDETQISEIAAGSERFSGSIVIDFSSDEGAARAVALAARRASALLIGTTGLSETTRKRAMEASKKIPVLIAPNTSRGVCAVAAAVTLTVGALGRGWSSAIVEAHHIAKKDAPSGTALRLAAAIRDAGGEIDDGAIKSIRAGDIIGEHTIRFAGPGETIEITHRATSRDLFARGALDAGAALAAKPAGWYSIEQVFGLK